MTYDQLLAFLAVADTGTFAAASQHLHKSQPAVSKLVSNLESELGVALFDRSQYRPVLTEAGTRLRLRAEHAVAAMREVEETARAIASQPETKVRLVMESVTPMARVTSALLAVRARFAHAHVELRTDTLASTLDRLVQGEADIAIGQLHDLSLSGVDVQPFDTVHIVPVAHHSHPLAQHPGPLSTSALANHVQVVLREQSPPASAYSLNVVRGVQHWFVSDVSSKLEVIRAALGWGGLPHSLVAEDLRDGTLVVLDLPKFKVSDMVLSLLRRNTGTPNPVADALYAALQSPKR